MHFKNRSLLISVLLILLTLVSYGCGKKETEKNEGQSEESNPRQLSQLEVELQKQELICYLRKGCPSYIVKIAIVHNKKLKFCTGFLTEDNVVATAANCLPDKLRADGLSCKRDVFFFFEQEGIKPEMVGCKKVVDVIPTDGADAYLWRSDIAYLELDSKEIRRSVTAIRTGMGDKDKFYIWSIQQEGDMGIIRRTDNCEAVHRSYFNPLANHNSSPVMMVAGCDFNEGNSGSPVFDYRGKVRGIVSAPLDKEEIFSAISRRILGSDTVLKSFLHVTNFACAPIFPYQAVLDEAECNKELSVDAYKMGQKEMTSEDTIFRTSIREIEYNLNQDDPKIKGDPGENKYISFTTRLIETNGSFKVDIYPKCFKNVSSWLRKFTWSSRKITVNMPIIKIKKSMNEFGLLGIKKDPVEYQEVQFKFKPKELRKRRGGDPRKANIVMTVNEQEIVFENVSEVCPSLF